MIQEIRQQAYGALFRGHIRRDFPPRERRPLPLLRRLHRGGLYTLLAMRDDETGQLLAYAGLLRAPNLDSMLLDYLAVEPEHRDKGVGSRFLGELVAYCDTGGIIIECDSPRQAPDGPEKKIRERRIDFYMRGGAVQTGVDWYFIGVHYQLLWLPVRKALQQVDVAHDISALYSTGVPRPLRRVAERVLKRGIKTEGT